MKSITYKCAVCNNEWTVSYSNDALLPDGNKSCPYCEHNYLVGLFNNSPAEFQAEVDSLIHERKILEGMRLIRSILKLYRSQGNELFSWRYDQLRDTNSKKFICSHEAYWDGYYS